MNLSGKILLAFCGGFLLAAFPVFGQTSQPEKLPADRKSDNIVINKKPFLDLGLPVTTAKKDSKNDLTDNFKIKLHAKLKKTTVDDIDTVRLDSANSRWLWGEQSGNQVNADLAMSAIEAVSDSGFFGYFSNLGISEFFLSVGQDDQDVSIKFDLLTETETKAKTLASAFTTLVSAAKLTFKDEVSGFVLGGYDNSAAKDKIVSVNFRYSKPAFHDFLDKQLNLLNEK